jgi:hypothetical protein
LEGESVTPEELERQEREKFRQESMERRKALKAASPEGMDAILRQMAKARKERPQDHGTLPSRE